MCADNMFQAGASPTLLCRKTSKLHLARLCPQRLEEIWKRIGIAVDNPLPKGCDALSRARQCLRVLNMPQDFAECTLPELDERYYELVLIFKGTPAIFLKCVGWDLQHSGDIKDFKRRWKACRSRVVSAYNFITHHQGEDGSS